MKTKTNRVPNGFGWIALSVALFAGCKSTPPPAAPTEINYAQELPPGSLALRKIPPSEYPDFSQAFTAMNVPSLQAAIDNSLKYLASPSSQQAFPYLDITHDRAVETLKSLRQLLDQRGMVVSPAEWNRRIAADFEVYKSIGAPKPDGPGYTERVLFTGYCTPIYDASMTREGPFQYPLYKRPTNPASMTLSRGQIEINQSPLAGQELVWLKSRWEAYVVTVQGSARLRLTDGSIYEVGYAGNNGYDYTSPGLKMVQDGLIRKQDLSLKTLGNYFATHPAAMDRYLPMNQRFVFFTSTQGGPFGSLGVPVTPMCTIATDKSVYPRAMPAFLNVPMPADESGRTYQFRGFMLDQDTGGAIRAAGRTDIYMGIGPQAEQLAGRQLNSGELYYLAVKLPR